MGAFIYKDHKQVEIDEKEHKKEKKKKTIMMKNRSNKYIPDNITKPLKENNFSKNITTNH